MMRLFYTGLVVLMLMVAGCSRKTSTTTSTFVKDSVHVEYVDRDVEVKLPGDTVYLPGHIECDPVTDKPKPSSGKKKSGRLTLDYHLDAKGKINITCAEDSLKTIIKAQDKLIFQLRHSETKKTEVIEVYKTRRIDIICRWIAAILLVVVLIKIYLKFIKPI